MVYHGNLWESMENFSILLTVLFLFFILKAKSLLFIEKKQMKKN